MRRITFLCLLAIIVALSYSEAAPAPKRTDAKPAVINAGTEKNIVWVLESVVWGARVGVRENKEVAGLSIVRRQKDWESWLKKNLRVERVPGKNLVRISFQDGNAKEQAAIINVVVDYYLKNDVKSRRDSERESIKTERDTIAHWFRRGIITAAEFAKAEEGIKKREEYIRTLPALVERAQAR